jgi:hypothetical protein
MDAAARALLSRAYRARGQWASTRLQDPTAVQRGLWLVRGINVAGRDPVDRGGFRAPNRWCRAFTRALWYQHKWYSAAPGGGWRAARRAAMRSPGIEVEFGRHRTVLGLIPAGYTVRVRMASAAAARRRGRPEDEWMWADSGERWADPANRDWAAFG